MLFVLLMKDVVTSLVASKFGPNGTYGRFPAHADACKSIVACQTHHLDEEFYATFYPDSTLPDAHREHMHVWHSH